MASLVRSGLNNIFHRKARLLIKPRSLSRSRFDSFLFLTFEKSYVPSAKILHVNTIPSGKSFIYITDRIGPKTGLHISVRIAYPF